MLQDFRQDQLVFFQVGIDQRHGLHRLREEPRVIDADGVVAGICPSSSISRGLLRGPAEARVAEGLIGSVRRLVLLNLHVDGREIGSQFGGQGSRRISYDWQAATFGRAVKSECRDDNRSGRLEVFSQTFDIGDSITFIGEKVEHGSVVPDIYRRYPPIRGDVGSNPPDEMLLRSQATLGPGQRCPGDVQHCETGQTAGKQVIHEAGIPASDVDQSTCGFQSCGVDEVERRHRLRLEPTEFLAPFRRIDFVPMRFALHRSAP